jgi:hypothetical protein
MAHRGAASSVARVQSTPRSLRAQDGWPEPARYGLPGRPNLAITPHDCQLPLALTPIFYILKTWLALSWADCQ